MSTSDRHAPTASAGARAVGAGGGITLGSEDESSKSDSSGGGVCHIIFRSSRCGFGPLVFVNPEEEGSNPVARFASARREVDRRRLNENAQVVTDLDAVPPPIARVGITEAEYASRMSRLRRVTSRHTGATIPVLVVAVYLIIWCIFTEPIWEVYGFFSIALPVFLFFIFMAIVKMTLKARVEGVFNKGGDWSSDGAVDVVASLKSYPRGNDVVLTLRVVTLSPSASSHAKEAVAALIGEEGVEHEKISERQLPQLT